MGRLSVQRAEGLSRHRALRCNGQPDAVAVIVDFDREACVSPAAEANGERDLHFGLIVLPGQISPARPMI
jgi:hypothetical protein